MYSTVKRIFQLYVDLFSVSYNTVGMTGKEMKIARAHLEMSQTDLAATLGIAPNTVSRYEVGSMEIPKAIVLAVDGLLCRQSEQERSKAEQTESHGL
jgi:DNA-binding XRE family transcriptional regulator